MQYIFANIADMICEKCGKKAGDKYRALAPKYQDDQII